MAELKKYGHPKLSANPVENECADDAWTIHLNKLLSFKKKIR